MGVVIKYVLTEEGQRQSLLQGGTGKKVQKIRCPEELYPKALPLAVIADDGEGLVNVGNFDFHPNDDRILGHPTTGYEADETTGSYRASLEGYWDKHFSYPEYVAKYLHESEKFLVFDAPQEPEALLDAEQARQQKLDEELATVMAEIKRLNKDKEHLREEALAARDKAKKEYEEREKRRGVREEAEKERRKREKVEAEREREAWIREHGSERLKAILEEGFLENSMTVYREERLAVERPGWSFNPWPDDVDFLEPRNPSLERIRWLRKEREIAPDAELAFAKGDVVYDEDGYWCTQVREICLTAEFLGRTIVRREDEVA